MHTSSSTSSASDEYARRGLTDRSDDALLELAATVVSRPKAVPADSFRLHAPLELLARRALLGLVDPARREDVRRHLIGLAAAYARSEEPDPSADHTSPLPALSGDAIVSSLAAAAHAPIFCFLLPRVAPRSAAAASMVGPLARELDRHPEWKIGWFDDRPPRGSADTSTLTRALLDTPRLGLPGSDFIYPIVHQVDASGTASDVLSPVTGALPDLEAATRVLSRVAAWSMLHDDPAHAPYGWTHCLTIPQAIAAVAGTTRDPQRALVMAATHVVAFRAALSDRPVPPGYSPEPVDVEALDALDGPPAVAAAAVHHAPSETLDAIVTALATRAALHPDAHVAKYTLACFDAAHADPSEARLYLSAAAYLGGWWANVTSR